MSCGDFQRKCLAIIPDGCRGGSPRRSIRASDSTNGRKQSRNCRGCRRRGPSAACPWARERGGWSRSPRSCLAWLPPRISSSAWELSLSWLLTGAAGCCQALVRAGRRSLPRAGGWAHSAPPGIAARAGRCAALPRAGRPDVRRSRRATPMSCRCAAAHGFAATAPRAVIEAAGGRGAGRVVVRWRVRWTGAVRPP